MALTKKHTLRLSDEEDQELTRLSAELGMNKSSLIRDIFMKNKVKVMPKDDRIKLLFHQNKIGNNLNQVAHGINKAFLSGKVSEELFRDYINLLNIIRRDQRNVVELVLYGKDK